VLWLGLVLGLGFVGLGLGLASQTSRVFLCGMSIHTATGEASRVFSISLYNYKQCTFKVNTGKVR